MRLTNLNNIPLPLAVWLATSNYDGNKEPNEISVTTLMKPLKQIILSKRVNKDDLCLDVSSLAASTIGTALHDSIEQAWLNPNDALTRLGISEMGISKIKINPDPSTVAEDDIAIYMEQRAYKKVGTKVVSGKYDLIFDGQVQDYKSTSVYTYLKNDSKKTDYILQGSIYRWLNPDLIIKDTIAINYILKDWTATRALGDATYPRTALIQEEYPLLSLEQTEKYIRNKLRDINRYMDSPEEDIPECSSKDLWRGEAVFKYYASDTATRSSKNFGNMVDAAIHMSSKGGRGFIKQVDGKAKACSYCMAATICQQRAELAAADELG